MSDIMKKAKNLVKEAKDNLDMKELKNDAKKVGEMLKDGKISKEEKKEIGSMAKSLMKDMNKKKKK